ncbi:MAG TPA: biosynthetic peptidoglycan transglycosylase [Streptosporangiaceae bacterium]|nr:biosynthetic peptidoglycan transglycosylase [Streptosporangiaceae bacterium]
MRTQGSSYRQTWRKTAPAGAAQPGPLPRYRRRWFRFVLKAVLALLLIVVAGAGILMAITPSVGSAWSLARKQATAHHAPFPGPPVSQRFSAALIATEDHRFGSEPGVDPIAIGRVLFAGITGGGDQGGATLYQQLAKILYTPNQGGVPTEIKQIALAVKLKFSYTDPQILRMYAAIVYFGHGFYGLQAASCGYFGRQPNHLSWPQAAVLAGLVQAPSAYDPLVFPRLARSREQHVISRLVATKTLTRPQAAKAMAVPISTLTANAGGCRA